MINKLLEKRDVLDQPKGENVNRRRADELVVTLWCQRTKADRTVGPEADKKLNALTDLTHGLGALFVASLAALVTVVTASLNVEAIKQEGTPGWGMAMYACSIIMVLICLEAHWRVGKLAQGVVQESLKDALKKEAKKQPSPIISEDN
jgi:hypothetical protein